MINDFNPFSLEGKVILVTGASSGIGRAVAIVCSKMGANLIINGRDESRLNETFQALSTGQHKIISGDVTQSEIIETLASHKIDGIVHCAGISGHTLFSFLKQDEIDKMFDVNFFAPLKLTQKLLKSKNINKNGSIVFITSTSGILSSYIGGTLYSSTKGALNGMLKGLALECAPRNIRVNSVMPSMVETPIMQGDALTQEQWETDRKLYPLKRYGRPEEVAYAVTYFLSNASAWVTGTNLLMDGGRSISY